MPDITSQPQLKDSVAREGAVPGTDHGRRLFSWQIVRVTSTRLAN